MKQQSAALAADILRPPQAASKAGGLSFNAFYAVAAIALLDIASMLAFFLASFAQAQLVEPDLGRVWKATDAVFCASMLYLMVVTGIYRETNVGRPFSQVSRILLNGLMIASTEWCMLWMLDVLDEYEWPWMGPINIVSGGVLCMCATRFLAYKVLQKTADRGGIVNTVAIVGGAQQGQLLIAAMRQRKNPWTKIIGIFDDRAHRLDGEQSKVDGTIDDLIRLSRERRIDEVVVALPWNAKDRLLCLLDQLKVIPANIRLAPDVIGHHFLDEGFDKLEGVPVYNVYRKPISGWASLAKRAEDVLLGIPILVALAPLLIITAIAIKLDSKGPVLFRQKRYGFNNQLIGVYKFRSMYHELRDESASKLTSQNDPRVTRVGRVIRKTSIDELPQLFNVILGQMSLVGPRPHATQAKAAGLLYEQVVAEYAVRHKVKPGITGWAQVNGWRGETDTEEKIVNRVKCDLYYMENWSIFLDIEILFRTLGEVVGKNAY